MAEARGIQRETIYIIIAVVCGVLGIFLVRGYVEAKLKAYREQLENVKEVVRAKRRLPMGKLLSEELVTKEAVPARWVHPRAILASDMAKILGRGVNTPIEKDETLLWYQMDMGRSATVSEKISEGQKAVTIPVTAITGAAGLLRPNIAVDLYATFKLTKGGPEAGPTKGEVKTNLIATRLMENITVVAVGTNAAMTPGGALLGGATDIAEYSSVTLLVNAKDVEGLLLAHEITQEQGTNIYCILRSEMETTTEEAVPGRVMTDEEFLQMLSRARPGAVR
jgi:pilus assembly protein CpaB